MFRGRTRCAAALCLAPALASATGGNGGEGVVELYIEPRGCVTLYEAQTCELRLELGWSTPPGARYCLHRERVPEPLVCWEDDELERYAFDFVGAAAESFFVRRRSDGAALAEARFTREWVYRGDRSGASGWRLF